MCEGVLQQDPHLVRGLQVPPVWKYKTCNSREVIDSQNPH